MCKANDIGYRTWWCWHEGGVKYVIVPDMTEHVPYVENDREWFAACRYRTVAEAMAFIAQVNAKSHVTYEVTVQPIINLDVTMNAYDRDTRSAESDREHEAASIARMTALDELAKTQAREARLMAERHRDAWSA